MIQNLLIISEIQSSGSEQLWARHGLTGLVLFALFSIIFLFIRFNQTKAKEDRAFIDKILTENREERQEIREDSNRNIDRLTVALDSLTESIRAADCIQVHKKDK